MVTKATVEVDVMVKGENPNRPRLQVKFEVPAGITVLFGPSGAGKTTTLNVIAGLLSPHKGKVVIHGEVVEDVEQRVHVATRQRRTALVFQSLALFPHLSAIENVRYGAPKKEQALYWLERVKAVHLSDRRPATFSGGEAQRVALARALASEPRVLLLDEPFSALDRELRRTLGAELQGLVNELQIPTILVTHDRDEAATLGSRIIYLKDGTIQSPTEVRR